MNGGKKNLANWIFFDLDGTLINHQYAADKAVLLILEGVLGLNDERGNSLLKHWQSVSEYWYQRYLRGELSMAEQRRARLREFSPDLLDQECDQIFDLYASEYERSCAVYPDVPETLFRLKPNFELGVITNGESEQQRGKLKSTGLDSIFRLVLVSSEEGVSKPDPRIFDRATQRTGSDAAEIVFIGDKLDTDAEAATRSGMRGIWLNRDSIQRSNATPTIHNLLELCTVQSEIFSW